MSEVCAVQVGIRIRPFNEREKQLGAKLCVDVNGPATILQNVDQERDGKRVEPRKFTFDASFWSHDGFEEGADGYMRALPGSRYADQHHVYQTFGTQLLDNAWDGYHCCLFAYGQTGSGKSYSMVGYGANRGIVPCACDEIFKRIQGQPNGPDGNTTFEVTVSMIEIYNEAVQDLLVAPKLRSKRGLEIHESKQLGVYVKDVQRRAVDSYAAIDKVLKEGTSNRSVGATLMNETSSRAHTVLTIEFKQVMAEAGSKVSMINLVDLAGSEKANQSGASGDRLKEACAINKSLSALGNVIEKLADVSTGKAKAGSVIPYRDSKLTRLLQNALGGSSKTIMICAVSPASSNYEESLSTLRYADRAKRIKNSAQVNENPHDKIIRSLKEENEKLKSMLEGEELAKQQAEIAELERALAMQEKSFADKLSEAQKLAEQAARDESQVNLALPHISNLNEDRLLTNKIQFAFPEGRTRIGAFREGPARLARTTSTSGPPDVALNGPGIYPDQAVVVNTGGVCVLTAIGPAVASTFINGQKNDGSGVTLNHGDRVVFGSLIFVFIDPRLKQGLAEQLITSGQVSYEAARKEVALTEASASQSEQELAESRRKAEELERQVKLAEEAKLRAEQEAAALLQQREQDYQARIASLQTEWDEQLRAKTAAQADQEAAAAEQAKQQADQLAVLQKEFEEKQRLAEEQAQQQMEDLEKRAREAAAKEEDHRRQQLNMQKLDEQLALVLPLIKEANLIAEELKRPQQLELKMHVELANGENTIRVTVGVWTEGVELYEWTPEILENRVFIMRDLLERCDIEGLQVANELPIEEDPWWDPVQSSRLIGVSRVILLSLLEQMDHQLDVRILSSEGRECGKLRVEIWPVSNKTGTPGIPDDEVLDDLLSSRMVILLRIPRATGLPRELANDVRIEYRYFLDADPHQVPPVAGFNVNPQFNYEKTFVQDPVTEGFLEYCNTQQISFYVYGRSVEAEKVQQAEIMNKTGAQFRPATGATPRQDVGYVASADAASPRPASAPVASTPVTTPQAAPAPVVDQTPPATAQAEPAPAQAPASQPLQAPAEEPPPQQSDKASSACCALM